MANVRKHFVQCSRVGLLKDDIVVLHPAVFPVLVATQIHNVYGG